MSLLRLTYVKQTKKYCVITTKPYVTVKTHIPKTSQIKNTAV